jgi:hypothetical protein
MFGLFDLMDQALADELGVDVKTYISIIEQVTDEEQEQIIMGILENDSNKRMEAIELFNLKKDEYATYTNTTNTI